MYISNTKQFIFIHIPKNAGTTIKKILLPYIDEHTYSIIGELVKKTGPSYPSHEKFSLSKKNQYKNYFTFAFVRNPWARHLSYYSFKTRTKEWFPKLFPTFESYIKSLTKKVVRKEEIEWRDNQSSWIYDDKDNLLVDFVGKLENLQDDLKTVFDKLSLQFPSSSEFPHMKNSRIDDYRKYYTDEMREIVCKHNQRDIRLLNYEF